MIQVEIDETKAVARVVPERGRPVTFEVRQRDIRVTPPVGTWGRTRVANDVFVVGLKGSDGDGFAHFRVFERACESMLSRARRYERAFRADGIRAEQAEGADVIPLRGRGKAGA